MKKSLGAKTYLYPTPVLVIGTYDDKGKPNIAPVSWAGICCSDPPCIAISMRKATYTYKNILLKKAFTISIPSQNHIAQTDYLGMVSGRDIDKFAKAKLTPVKSSYVDAPYVEEFPVILECELFHTIELGIHTQFVGKVLNVRADESLLDNSGALDIKKIKPLIFTPDTYAYYGVGDYLGQAFSKGENLK